jgi:hypothetical protein
MPGAVRRNKPLKAKSSLDDLTDFVVTNPADGDLLVYDAADGDWENGRTLTGDYGISGTLTLGVLSTSSSATIGGSLTVSTDLAVAGDATITDDLVADEATFRTITTTGAAVLGSTASIAGLLTGAGFSFSGNGTIAGTLAVTGTLTAGSLVFDSATVDDLTVLNNTTTGSLTVLADAQALSVSATGGVSGADGTFTTSVDAGQVTIKGGLAAITHDATDMYIDQQQEDGLLYIRGTESVGSTTNNMIVADPLGSVDMYFADALRVTYTTDEYDLSAFVGNIKMPWGTTAQAPATPSLNDMRFDTDIGEWMVGGLVGWERLVPDPLTYITDNSGTTSANLWYGGTPTLAAATQINGFYVYDTAGTNPGIRLFDNLLTDVALWQGQNASTGLTINNLVDSGLITLQGYDVTTTLTTLAQFDPDGAVDSYYSGTLVMSTTNGGISVLSTIDVDPLVGATTEGGQINFNGAGAFADWNMDNASGKLRIFQSGIVQLQFNDYTTGTSPLMESIVVNTEARGIRFGRTSTQHVKTWGTATANYLASYGSTGNTKGWILNATTDSADGAGTASPTMQLQIRGTTEANINSSGLSLGTSTTIGLTYPTGTYGTVETFGTGVGSWSGYSINGYSVFMGNSTDAGIYNDTNNEWMILCSLNAEVALYYNGLVAGQTTSAGFEVRHPSSTLPTLTFTNNSGTELARIQHAAATGLLIRSVEHGKEIRLECEDGTSGTVRRPIRMAAAAAASQLGFFDTAPQNKPTSVAVTAAGIHAALVTLGLIS